MAGIRPTGRENRPTSIKHPCLTGQLQSVAFFPPLGRRIGQPPGCLLHPAGTCESRSGRTESSD